MSEGSINKIQAAKVIKFENVVIFHPNNLVKSVFRFSI